MIMIMSMRLDYVSELWPLTGLLFIPQVSSLAKLPAGSSLASRMNGRKKLEFGIAEYFCSYLQVIF